VDNLVNSMFFIPKKLHLKKVDILIYQKLSTGGQEVTKLSSLCSQKLN